MTSLIGSNYQDILQNATRPHFDHCFFADEELILKAASTAPWRSGEDVLFVGCITGMMNNARLLTKPFLYHLRQTTGLRNYPTEYFNSTSTQLRVAMHIRRGDLHIGNPRGLPDSSYYKLIKAVRPYMPEAEIHVFSSTEGNYGPSDFAGYTNRGMAVHLDGDEVADWAHMAQADVLLLSPSSFSWVPGVLNPNCVVAFSRFYPLDNWVVHRDGDFDAPAKKRLHHCIGHARAAHKRRQAAASQF